jgi:hypothetical protein
VEFARQPERSRSKSRPSRTAEERSSEHARRANASLRLAHLDQPRQADELKVILEELAALKSAQARHGRAVDARLELK